MRNFIADNGETLTALDDTQADAMIKGGMTEIFEDNDTEITNEYEDTINEKSDEKKTRKNKKSEVMENE